MVSLAPVFDGATVDQSQHLLRSWRGSTYTWNTRSKVYERADIDSASITESASGAQESSDCIGLEGTGYDPRSAIADSICGGLAVRILESLLIRAEVFLDLFMMYCAFYNDAYKEFAGRLENDSQRNSWGFDGREVYKRECQQH